MARPIVEGAIFHTGSTLQGPVNSTLDSDNFVLIEGKPIGMPGDLIDTPSHHYANSVGPPVEPLFHSHPSQIIDSEVTTSSYFQIEGDGVILDVGSESTPEVTTIDGAGQDFVHIL